jgi:hypothetical protein
MNNIIPQLPEHVKICLSLKNGEPLTHIRETVIPPVEFLFKTSENMEVPKAQVLSRLPANDIFQRHTEGYIRETSC